MRKAPSLFLMVLLASPVLVMPAAAAPWVRGFVVDNYEPAFFYGAKLGSTEAPGSDCPKGTIQDNDYNAILKTSWRPAAEVAAITDPASHATDTASFGGMSQALSHRGYRKEIDTYINPFTAPDPGMQQVTGKIGEGFNLDGKLGSNDFVSPSGERGIDNNFYRAWGCIMSYRGTAYHAYLSERANDKMLEGLYTMVIRVSGNQDPMNDTDATVEIGYSPEQVTKDVKGHVIGDYSFRLVKDAQYTKLKARVANGVVDTEQVAMLRAPEFSWGETNRGEAQFQKGKLRFTIGRDGSVSGLIGGYRDWRDLYGKDTFNVPSEGPTREIYYHENQIGMYYALKRNADGIPDPKTGQNTGISTAYRFSAQPAYIADPKTAAMINEPPFPTGQRAYDERAAFVKATTTKVISPEVRRRAGEVDELAPKGADTPAAPSPNNKTAAAGTPENKSVN